jgi:hypothetical protein
MDTFEIETSKIERGRYRAKREDGRSFEVRKSLSEWHVKDEDTGNIVGVTDTKKMAYFDIRYDYLRDPFS